MVDGPLDSLFDVFTRQADIYLNVKLSDTERKTQLQLR